MSNYLLSFVSVCCESGEIDAAMNVIPPGAYENMSWVDLGIIGRCSSHAAAGTYLMRGLWILKKNDHKVEIALHSLYRAKAIYEALNKIYLGVSNPSVSASIRHFCFSWTRNDRTSGVALRKYYYGGGGSFILANCLASWRDIREEP